MQNKNITYLLGAGASYQAMPVLAELSKELQNYLPSFLSIPEFQKLIDSKLNPFPYDSFQHLAYELYHLGKDSESFNTIDTFAKMLLANQSHDELVDLKKHFNLFLSIWQLLKDKTITSDNNKRDLKEIDPRYIALMASLLDLSNGINILNNINFVTWNYDLQLELAFRKFIKGSLSMRETNDYLKFIPEQEESKLQVVHLNGFCGFYYREYKDYKHTELAEIIGNNEPNQDSKNLIATIFEELYPRLNNYNPSFDGFLNFAWEKGNSLVEYARKQAIEIAKNTDELVIIGYSFPIFNREVDSVFFNNLKRVRVIHYQDPNANAQFLRRTFNITDGRDGITGIPLVDIRVEKENMTQFIIPN